MNKQRDYTVKPKSLPDLGGIFQQMKLRDKLEQVSDQSILGYTILLALSDGKPLGKIISTIMDSYTDNPNAVLEVIGQDTMDMIKQLLSKNKSHA